MTQQRVAQGTQSGCRQKATIENVTRFEAEEIVLLTGALSHGLISVYPVSDQAAANKDIVVTAGDFSETKFPDFFPALRKLPDLLKGEPIHRMVSMQWIAGEKKWRSIDTLADVKAQSTKTMFAMASWFKSEEKPTLNLHVFVVVLDGVDPSGPEFAWFHSGGTLMRENFMRMVKPSVDYGLNKNERKCLLWCACGKTSNEIAEILGLSEHTVNHYFILASQKLGVTNRAQAVARAIKLGIIDAQEVF